MPQQIRNVEFVGIDLATTRSVICIIDETGKPKVVPNLDGELHTPSLVFFGLGLKEIQCGSFAGNMLPVEPKRTFKEFKRDVGDDSKVYLEEGGRKIKVEDLQAELLKYLCNSVRKFFNDPNAAKKAVISVPANFDEKKRQSVIKSAQMAGIDVLRLINEPTAASLVYGLENTLGDSLAMVLDWGGGTLDCSIVKFQGQQIDALNSYGDLKLGGKDVDERLMGLLQKKFQQEHKIKFTPETHATDWYHALEGVIKAKHMLSARTKVNLIANAEGKQVIVAITRDEFTKLIADLLERAKATILECLKRGNVDIKDIKEIVLVGGSSRILAYQDTVKVIFGPERVSFGKINPDTAIAEGAAIEAARIISKAGTIIMDKDGIEKIPPPFVEHKESVPNSLGVAAQQSGSSKKYCSVVLERNMAIPCQVSKMYGSVDKEQTKFHVQVLQGEQGHTLEKCLVVADRILDLPARSPDKGTLNVTFGYDDNCMVHVFVEDLVSRRKEEITINFFDPKFKQSGKAGI